MNPERQPQQAEHRPLIERLARFDRLVEVGIGNRPAVAAALAACGASVTATDVHPRPVPEGVAFVRDDVTRPKSDVYADVEALYALNLPRELHRPARAVAREAEAEFLFTTLGGEFPSVQSDSETIGDETLFRATDRRGRRRSERA